MQSSSFADTPSFDSRSPTGERDEHKEARERERERRMGGGDGHDDSEDEEHSEVEEGEMEEGQMEMEGGRERRDSEMVDADEE